MQKARSIAYEYGLDLVEVSPNTRPPVVKLIDYGKFRYEQQKRKNEAKKRQHISQLKELQFRPNIETHDLETKLNRAKTFLGQGDRLKLVMNFRGREIAYKDAGSKKFNGIIERVVEMGAKIESGPKQVNNRILCILIPDKKMATTLKKSNKKS